MKAWYEEQPERYDTELKALRDANIEFEIDADAKAQGFLRLHLQINFDSTLKDIPKEYLPLKLTIVYPDLFPFFRAEVYAPALQLPRHQNHVGKNLCLIPRSTSFWFPENTIAEYLNDQLGKVLLAGNISDVEILSQDALEQAEPASEFYPATINAPIIFNPFSYEAMPVTKDIEFLGIVNLALTEKTSFPSALLVVESFDATGKSIDRLPENIKKQYTNELVGGIYKLTERPPHADAKLDLAWLEEKLKEQNERMFERREVNIFTGNITIKKIIGITFPEEIDAGVIGWGWLFIVDFIGRKQIFEHGRQKLVSSREAYYAKVSRSGKEELRFRIPTLTSLENKKIAIIGTGALGAPAAIEFARNGILELRLVDNDVVDVGPIVRWPLGLASVGKYKTAALKKFIDDNYPFTTVNTHTLKVGAADSDNINLRPPDFITQSQQLEDILNGVSLIFDATAEVGINHFLSVQAKNRSIPYVTLYATPGVWGGTIMRVIPNVTEGCWMCLQWSQYRGNIPKPLADPNGDIQAAGCGDISFTGTSFELQNLIQAAVRLAISTLCIQEHDGYPDFNSDIGVLNLTDGNGKSIFPEWSEHKLEIHPECPYCRSNEQIV